jgi:hypothetical protein
MRDSAYCRAQAGKCRELAMNIGDQGMIEHLLLIAEEYEAEASRLDGEAKPDPVNEVPLRPKPENQ